MFIQIYWQRVALESALSHLNVDMIRKICLELGKLVNVKPPHQVLEKFLQLKSLQKVFLQATVMPELYLSYAFLADKGNKSNQFKIFERSFSDKK